MSLLSYFKHRLLDWIRYRKNLYFNEHVKSYIARFHKSNNKKDVTVINNEMKDLKEYWGDIPMQYITHDFYNKNCPLTIEEMKEYIPGYFFYYVIYPKYDDVKKVSALTEDKIKSYYLFKSLGYSIVEPLFFTERGCYDPVNSEYLSNKGLSEWLIKCKSPKLFVKPVRGRGGKGIYIAHRINGDYFVDKVSLNFNFLKNLKGHYVIEPGIVQSDYISSVYADSVNTLRVITKREKNSCKISIVAITLRMGCSGKEVDNGSQGGLLMGIDHETGSPINGYAVYTNGSERFYKHPDSGYRFSDFCIKDWPKYRAELTTIAEKMKEINLAGWDIAITDDGPLVIETNVQFGIDGLQSGVGGLKKHFVSGSPLTFLEEV